MKYEIVKDFVFNDGIKSDTLYLKKDDGNITHVFFECPCGKDYVNLPIGKGGWSMKFQNNKITLHPSIKRIRCKLHFWIIDSKVVF